ncbi:MAG: hypothetical protein V7785_21380 [Bermanella sp.]
MLNSIGMNSRMVMHFSVWHYLLHRHLKQVFLILGVCWGLLGCSSDSGSEEVIIPKLSGLWVGETTENIGAISVTLDSYILFFNDQVYVFRTDEAQVGSYVIEDTSHSNLLVDVHPYSSPDAINQFYIGRYNNLNLTLDALFASNLDLVVNYNSITRAGRMTLELDVEQQLELTIARIIGEWDTTDATMSIAADGGFSGWNELTSCQWEGELTPLTSNMLTLTIERENCAQFNTLTQGLAFVDGEGILHFIATASPDILWMQFDPVAQTTVVEVTD